MYELRVRGRFSALHQLRMYDGQLEPLHGHDWRIEAVLRGPELDRIGVLADFIVVQDGLHAVTRLFDHRNLNEHPLLAGLNPSAETVARCVFEQLSERLGKDCPLAAVYIEEAPGCIAGYIDVA